MTTFPARRGLSPSFTRRSLAAALAGGALAASVRAPFGLAAARQSATPAAGTSPDAIIEIVRQRMDELSLRATILRVEIDGEEVVLEAIGESMTGVPATTDMYFRNGAVAISLISTLMLTLVDDGTIGLDDPIAPFLPDLPDSDKATFRMLSNMTAGYRDHVQSTDFLDTLLDEPFRSYTPDDIIAYSLAEPRLFAPGTNWEYSHTNYFILGLALEAATGQPVEQLMQERVLDPLGLTATIANQTAAMPEPALHAFSSERREWLGIPAGTRFYEESTYWNPSWTLTRGAVQTQSIGDFAASMVAVGEGTLLSAESKAAMFEGLLGFGAPLEGCNSCHTLDEDLNYGLGVVMHGPWVLQNPMFSGCSGVSGYLPERKISIAVVNTYGEGAFDDQGVYTNASVHVFQALADALAPDLATPVALR
jgi:CubicO group peptidase (beta-lactamase class C family)